MVATGTTSLGEPLCTNTILMEVEDRLINPDFLLSSVSNVACLDLKREPALGMNTARFLVAGGEGHGPFAPAKQRKKNIAFILLLLLLSLAHSYGAIGSKASILLLTADDPDRTVTF